MVTQKDRQRRLVFVSVITGIEIIIDSVVVVAGYDLLLGSIAAFYVFAIPYTKVEESFNIQVLQLSHKTISNKLVFYFFIFLSVKAMHDILYHRHRLENVSLPTFSGVL